MSKEKPEVHPSWMYKVADQASFDVQVVEDILRRTGDVSGQELTLEELKAIAASQAGYGVPVEDRRELQALLVAAARGELEVKGLEVEVLSPESAYQRRWEKLQEELVPPAEMTDHGTQVFWRGMDKLVDALGKTNTQR